jgi:hypothetical protein
LNRAQRSFERLKVIGFAPCKISHLPFSQSHPTSHNKQRHSLAHR